jgi:hypothetical protein
MQGYIRVSAPGSSVKLTANISEKSKSQMSRMKQVGAGASAQR